MAHYIGAMHQAEKRSRPSAPLPSGTLARGLGGLAAAIIPKPTVAQYAQHFRYLEIGIFAHSSGPYGEALRHPVMVVYRNFPKKRVLMGEERARKSLKRHHLSSTSFPKKLLLEELATPRVLSP